MNLTMIIMKNNPLIRSLAILIIGIAVIFSCTKENEEVRLDETLATTQVLSVTAESAKVVGFVIASGDGFSEKGVCYNTQPNPTTANNKVAYTGEDITATFTVTLSGLSYTTKYYARAYAVGKGGTIYGEEFSFTTTPAIPVVTTADIADVTSSAAKSGGAITDMGGADISARGVVYGLTPNPTLADQFTIDGDGEGAFMSQIRNLTASTTYYVRAYATNVAGTGYGNQVEFTTLAPVVPSLTTLPVRSITGSSAQSGGAITDEGGATVTARGVVYSTNPNPTLSDNKTEDGEGPGEFESRITGLEGLTTYYVRAYATNSVGTAYGAERTFTTLAPVRIWYLPGNYVEASYPESEYKNWDPANSPFIKSLAASPHFLEGFIYMANPNNEWKFTGLPSWDLNWGSENARDLVENGPNIQSPMGYYKITANANTMRYNAVATEWGVIGSATPLEWDQETPLAYSPPTRTWRGGITLAEGEFKFRANQSWSFNYGSTTKDEKLQDGGENIPVNTPGDYYFIMDLSHPNEYTYSADRWGLIGDATPDNWNSDQNMTWDPQTRSMTITLDLKVGSIKFRANDAWDINLGGETDNLTQGGDNIPINQAGNYTIKLFLDGVVPTCTIVKNS